MDVSSQKDRPSRPTSLSGTSRRPPGTHPVSRLPESPSTCRLSRLPRAEGISPVSWLVLSRRDVRPVRLPSDAGIPPLSWLELRCSTSRLERLPRVEGISPPSWLSVRNSRSSRSRLPRSAGSVPSSPLLERATTRARPSLSPETPCHCRMASSLSQLSLLAQLSPPVASYRATRAARSDSRLPALPGSPSMVRVKLPVSPSP